MPPERPPARFPALAIGDIGHRSAFHVGDEAMFEAFVPGTGSGAGWIAVSADPAHTTERLGVPAVPRLGFPDDEDDTGREARLAEVLGLASAGAAPSGDPAGAVLRALDGARALLVTGGGNLTANWPEHVYERVALITLARRRGLPVVVTGQTIGPRLRERERELLAEALSQAALVGVREPASHRLALALGVPQDRLVLQLDDAMFLPDEDPSAGPGAGPGEPWIAVSVPPLGVKADERRLLDGLAEQLATVARETGARIVLVPHEGSLDGALVIDMRVGDVLARHIERLGAPATALPVMAPARAAALTRRADLVIAARYHAVVFGLGGGVPCLAIHTGEYTKAKTQGALALAGMDAWSMHVEATGDLLAEAAMELWARREDARAHLTGLLPGWRESSARHAERVLAALDGVTSPGADVLPAAPGPQPTGSWRRAASLADRLTARNEDEYLRRRELERHAEALEATFGEAERYALSLRAALDETELERDELAELADRWPRRRRRTRPDEHAPAPGAAASTPAVIRLTDLRHEQIGEVAVASMAVEGGDGPTGRIALRRHGATLDEIDRSATPFASLAAVLATPQGCDAHIDGDVDETARAGAQAGGAQLASWFAWRAPQITVTTATPPVTPADGVALFFSRGLDSMASYARQRDRLTALIAMAWVDPPYADAGTDAFWRGTVEAAADSGLPLLHVSTNARDVLEPIIAWDFSHGAVLTALGRLLSPTIGEALVAGAFPSARASPSGTHPDLDHLWSSSAVRFVTEEGGGGRNEKAAIAGANPFCMRWLNVCWERPGERSCGRCCKCVITLMNFKIAGRLDEVRDRFEADLTPEAVMGVAIEGTPTTPLNAELVLERLDEDDPLRPPWEAMLARALALDAATAREEQAVARMAEAPSTLFTVDVDVTASEALAAENARLRERVEQLEADLGEQAARTNALLAQAQERTYWLDRWHLDLNALMERPGAAQFRLLLRLLRAPVRAMRRLKRRLLG